jgi:hypothetical protein
MTNANIAKIVGFSIDSQNTRKVDQLFSFRKKSEGIAVTISVPRPVPATLDVGPPVYYMEELAMYGYVVGATIPSLSITYRFDAHIQALGVDIGLSNARNVCRLSFEEAESAHHDDSSDTGRVVRSFTKIGLLNNLFDVNDKSVIEAISGTHNTFLRLFRRDAARFAAALSAPVILPEDQDDYCSTRTFRCTAPCRDKLARFNVGQISETLAGEADEVLSRRLGITQGAEDGILVDIPPAPPLQGRVLSS